MIELKVKDYCQDCPNFEARNRMVEQPNGTDGPIFHIRCVHEQFCEQINKHIAEKYGKKEESGVIKRCDTCKWEPKHQRGKNDGKIVNGLSCFDCKAWATPDNPHPYWTPRDERKGENSNGR